MHAATETKPDTREEMSNCSPTHGGGDNAGGCRCATEAAAAPLLLGVAEVARLLTCSQPHVRRLADAGRMPRPVKLGTLVRWKRAEIEQWLEMTEKNTLEERIYHVLQEHFTGIRLPERAKGNDRRLYITLSRRKNEIRQSAQVVLAQIDWSADVALELVTREDAVGRLRTDLRLEGKGRIKGANLVMTLPFLDYIGMRHFGELGEILQAAYVERLERFKAQVQKQAMETSSDVMLVRLKTDHTFRRQQYTVRDGKLEVNDVL